MKPGKYRNVSSPRPIEIAHGRLTFATENLEVFDNIDLTLEGQAALIQKIIWTHTGDTVLADANDDLYLWQAILSMNESFSNSTFNTDMNAILDDENTIDYFSQSFQNVITTSGQTILPVGKTEMHDFSPDGILVPETIRLAGVVIDGGSVQSVLDVMVYYKRIEKPTQAMKDYFYRRR